MIDARLSQDRSLNSYMSAIEILEQTAGSQAIAQPYRQQAWDMARAEAQRSQGNPSNPMPWVAIAKFSLQDRQDAEFRQATQTLAQKFPNDKHTYYFQGVQRLKDGDYKGAETALRQAEKQGMPAEDVGRLLKLAIDGQKWIWE